MRSPAAHAHCTRHWGRAWVPVPGLSSSRVCWPAPRSEPRIPAPPIWEAAGALTMLNTLLIYLRSSKHTSPGGEGEMNRHSE